MIRKPKITQEYSRLSIDIKKQIKAEYQEAQTGEVVQYIDKNRKRGRAVRLKPKIKYT